MIEYITLSVKSITFALEKSVHYRNLLVSYFFGFYHIILKMYLKILKNIYFVIVSMLFIKKKKQINIRLTKCKAGSVTGYKVLKRQLRE